MRQGGLKAFIIHALGGKTEEEWQFRMIEENVRKYPFSREYRETKKITARMAKDRRADEEVIKNLLSLEIGRSLAEHGAIEFETVDYGPGHVPEISASVYVAVKKGEEA